MNNDPVEHTFNFKLPMYPHGTVKDNGLPCELLMDGKELKGVTSLAIRAGVNGFTNVVVEFNADAAIDFTGALIPTINGVMDDIHFRGLFDKVLIEQGVTPEELIADGDLKLEFIKQVLTTLIAQTK